VPTIGDLIALSGVPRQLQLVRLRREQRCWRGCCGHGRWRSNGGLHDGRCRLVDADPQALMFNFNFTKVRLAKDGGEFPDKSGIQLVLASAHGFYRPLCSRQL
jgi:hypothetical protein